MRSWNGYQLDQRAKEDLEAEIKRLSESYVPEWKFEPENPDAASVIAKIFARQMAENIECYNMASVRFQQEFAKMLGMNPKPARPAQSVVVMRLDEDASSGMDIKAGTGFEADAGEQGEPVLFRAVHDIHAVNANLVQRLLICGKDGKLIPLNGGFCQPALLGPVQPLEDAEEMLEPFQVFDSSEPGITRNAIILYHSFGMDTDGGILYLRMEGTYDKKEFAAVLCEKENYRFSYYTEGKIYPAEEVWQDSECVCIRKSGQDQKIGLDGKEYTVLIIERLTPLKEDIWINKLEFFPEKGLGRADFICSDQQELAENHIPIFGQEISLYQNCYLGQEQVFGKKEAHITISFHLSFAEKNFLTGIFEEPEELPVIKRRERKRYQENWARVTVQEITLCYYNGTGWKMLPCDTDISQLFDNEEQAGECQISFLCPGDWEPVTVGAYQQRCLRMQVVRADDCYYRPACHRYPVLSDLVFSYEYRNHGLLPEQIEQRSGMNCCNVTKQIQKREMVTVFRKSIQEEEALLLGLDKVPDQGPVSIYVQLKNSAAFSGYPLTFYYGTGKSFRTLKVLDGTEGFQKSGMIIFIPTTDMKTMEIAGKNCFWIKIVRGEVQEKSEYAPIIQQIYLNGIQVHNVEQLEEEEYYIDHVQANMSFALSGKNILSAEVWVNEVNRLSGYQMEQMLLELPEETEAEYDISGHIAAFYVKWKETETFDTTQPQDRHYQIDRLQNRIQFGDGVHHKIPEVTNDTAFKVILSTCQGDRGNVGPFAIQSTRSNYMFLKEVKNPVAAAGGNNQEEESHMYQRGGNWFAGRGRLVSEQDYERAVLEFSDRVDKVRFMAGPGIGNTKEHWKIRMVLLMKEFEQGSMAFYKICRPLQEELLSRCEICCSQQEIEILEPVFVKISMDIWIELNKLEGIMEVQDEIIMQVTRFFHPLSVSDTPGWEIGQIPSHAQIEMMLNNIHTQAHIVNHMVTFTYTDHTGRHETEDFCGEKAIAVCMNGKHRVHVIQRKGGNGNDL